MPAQYGETEPVIPRMPFIALALTLVATEVFLAFLHIYDANLMELKWIGIMGAVFAITVAVAYALRVKILVADGTLTVGIVRRFSAPLDHVIDTKVGDIDVLRNYSGWGIKKVKFKTYTAHGIDAAVSVKLAGRVVLTVTTSYPEALNAAVRSGIEEG